jgi:hypothetical protein
MKIFSTGSPLTIISKMNWSLVVTVNSDEVLQRNLLRSSDIASAKEIIIQQNQMNASAAYNEALAKVTGDIVVFAHQDVYLPDGWLNQLSKSINQLKLSDARWGVLGAYGITASEQGAGYVYSAGLKRFVGAPCNDAIRVTTLDELILIIRKSSGLQFDECMPGFHLYGTDICLEAEAKGMCNYAVPCFVFHNSCGINWLPMDFWRAYMYLRRKWKKRLPVVTPCTRITSSFSAIYMDIIRRGISNVQGKDKPGCREKDTVQYYADNILHSRGDIWAIDELM